MRIVNGVWTFFVLFVQSSTLEFSQIKILKCVFHGADHRVGEESNYHVLTLLQPNLIISLPVQGSLNQRPEAKRQRCPTGLLAKSEIKFPPLATLIIILTHYLKVETMAAQLVGLKSSSHSFTRFLRSTGPDLLSLINLMYIFNCKNFLPKIKLIGIHYINWEDCFGMLLFTSIHVSLAYQSSWKSFLFFFIYSFWRVALPLIDFARRGRVVF